MRFAATSALMTVCLLPLAACSGRYLGVDRATLSESMLELHDRAETGDKNAQYDLARAYAKGEGVPRNCSKAKSLLRSAASSSGGRIWVYSPPVGNGTSGRVIPVDSGPKLPGLAKAKVLLEEPGFCVDSTN